MSQDFTLLCNQNIFVTFSEVTSENTSSMAEMALPVLFMGRGAWQKLAEPAALEGFIVKSGEFTLLTWALIISSAFVVFSLSLSSYLLFDHLSSYNVPEVRLRIFTILNLKFCSTGSMGFVESTSRNELFSCSFDAIKSLARVR